MRSNQQNFKSSLPKRPSFQQIRTLQVRAYALHAKLNDKEDFCHKISLKKGCRFDHHNWYVDNMERPLFLTEIEARRELSRIGLVSKHLYHPQSIQYNLHNNPRWQANIEANQGHFLLDRYRSFALQHGNLVYNPRDLDWIPNATDNPWAKCPRQNRKHEYHFIHKLKQRTTAIFLTLLDHMHVYLNFKNVVLLKHSKITKLILVTNKYTHVHKSFSKSTLENHL